METVKPRVSYADLQRMPDDGRRYELYDGELCVVPSPLPIHQVVARRLFDRLLRYASRRGGEVFAAPLGIVFSDYDVVQPDVIYFGSEKAGRIRLWEPIRFGPDLAIEVLSPATAHMDHGRRRMMLSHYRVPEYWIVDPRRKRIELFVLSGKTYAKPSILERGAILKSPTVTGLRVNVTSLFAGLEEPPAQ